MAQQCTGIGLDCGLMLPKQLFACGSRVVMQRINEAVRVKRFQRRKLTGRVFKDGFV
jgi:hypothetical protein